jgi:predicted ester cyclase
MNTKSITPESSTLNEESQRHILGLYAAAEEKNSDKFRTMFTEDGIFNDVSAHKVYRGKELPRVVEIYATAFPDMHRELYDMYLMGDLVVVELSLNGTHNGPLLLPEGTIPPTGNKIKAPCCDVFRLVNGKVLSFNCYVAVPVLLTQLGVFLNMEKAFAAGNRKVTA